MDQLMVGLRHGSASSYSLHSVAFAASCWCSGQSNPDVEGALVLPSELRHKLGRAQDDTRADDEAL